MRIFLFFVLSFFSFVVKGQDIFNTYPKTLVISNDSFALQWGKAGKDRYRLSRDTMNFNDGAISGSFFILYYNNDSIRLDYKNRIPYAQYTYFNFISGSQRKTIRLGFDTQNAIFGKAYMKENAGKVQFNIPEVYELANIIWTLSPSGTRAKDLNKYGDYYTKVLSYFKPFLGHPVFKTLDLPANSYASYFEFRENSFAFNFKDQVTGSANTQLLYNGPYYHVWGEQFADSSLFGKLKPLVEDFARESNFRKFYRDNMAFYRQQIQREKELMPVRQMWSWLEEEFPKTKYQSYRIVFSPLIGGSHSTQNYSSYNDTSWFSESVMFICNTDRVDTIRSISEKKKEGLISGVLFTEIDHNYVNRASNSYRNAIDSIFKSGIWTRKGDGSNFYGSPVSVFNEYMTWSVFCLYVLDTYEKDDADFIIAERESRMVDKRDFIKFKEFNRALIRLRNDHKELKTFGLYPYILDWCKQQL